MANPSTWADFQNCRRPCPRGASWWTQSGWRCRSKERRSPTCPFPRRVGRASPVLTTWKKGGSQNRLSFSSSACLYMEKVFSNFGWLAIQADFFWARTWSRKNLRYRRLIATQHLLSAGGLRCSETQAHNAMHAYFHNTVCGITAYEVMLWEHDPGR